MKTRGEVSADRLRGGYYTPPALVDFCLERAASLVGDRRDVAMLEPSAGDGAFLRGLARTRSGLGDRIGTVHAIELVVEEAAKAEVSMRSSGQLGRVERGSSIRWAVETDDWFGLVVGNPPFVRYQFVPDEDKRSIVWLAERLGLRFAGVANLWIPVLIGSLSRLLPGGVASIVLPTECFTGMSAGVVREWLLHNFEDLTFDLFPAGSFPDVLQEVAVMSGRKTTGVESEPTCVSMVEHSHVGTSRRWLYSPQPDDFNWTRSLLEPHHLEAIALAGELPAVARLGDVARLEVSIVTGANDFFCVDGETLSAHHLQPWARPLLARSRYSPGLIVSEADHLAIAESDARAWLLDFDPSAPDPTALPTARRYLQSGVERGLPERYKCRIREPWYTVPSVKAGSLMLSKRSHLYPRLLLNRAGVFTTDTIYRGDVIAPRPLTADDLVAAFHSSLTLLTVELESRCFGGGVLELVPSEVARLLVVASAGFRKQIVTLDRVARSGEPEDLVRATDLALAKSGLVPADVLAVLSEARHVLLSRRLHRNLAGEADRETWDLRAA